MTVRWLLDKDLRILRRSPLLSGLLVVYPVAVALVIGFALSSPPGKPRVALFSQVPPRQGTLHLGSQSIDIAGQASELFRSISPIHARSEEEAIADVRDGRALAALIIPGDIAQQVQSLVTTGVGSPTVQLILNSRDPLERQFVDQAVSARLAEVEQAVSRQVLKVAIGDLQQVLGGGQVQLLGQSVPLLGLRKSRTIVQRAIGSLPPNSPMRAALRQVVSFANLAIEGLGFASPVLGSIGRPVTVQETQLAGATTPTAAYAVAIAVAVSEMLVALLLAAGMLALERSENTYARLVRSAVSPAALLAEKVVLAAGCGTVLTLLMAAGVSSFVHLEWARAELWLLALALGGLAFAALGTLLGALAREISAASLLAILLALPVAFIALIPPEAVSSAVRTLLEVISFAFPFRAALQAIGNAFSATAPSALGPLLHLLALTALYLAAGRLALRRFATA